MKDDKIILEFPIQDERYTWGFSAGILWQKMKSGNSYIFTTEDRANLVLIQQMARIHNYHIEISETSAWETVDITLRKSGGRPLNNAFLKIIK